MFLGTVTNDSGTDLNTTDFFFNFGGYDPLLLTPNQDLGATNFPIANGSTSALTDLFSIAVGRAPASSTLVLSVQLEDSSNDLSALETVTLHVGGGSSGVPEPASMGLLGAGLVGLLLSRRRASALMRRAAASPKPLRPCSRVLTTMLLPQSG